MLDNSPTQYNINNTISKYCMRVEREHAFVFILRNGFLENSLEGLEVQQGIYVGVDEIYI